MRSATSSWEFRVMVRTPGFPCNVSIAQDTSVLLADSVEVTPQRLSFILLLLPRLCPLKKQTDHGRGHGAHSRMSQGSDLFCCRTSPGACAAHSHMPHCTQMRHLGIRLEGQHTAVGREGGGGVLSVTADADNHMYWPCAAWTASGPEALRDGQHAAAAARGCAELRGARRSSARPGLACGGHCQGETCSRCSPALPNNRNCSDLFCVVARVC
jgi:hypothetical protein